MKKVQYFLPFYLLFFFFLNLSFLTPFSLNAFSKTPFHSNKSLDIYVKAFKQKEGVLINLYYTKLPFQRIILALKEGNLIKASYNFTLYLNSHNNTYSKKHYKKNSTFNPIILAKTQKTMLLFYSSKENLYILKKEKQLFKFEQPEELLKYFLTLNSFFIPLPSNPSGTKKLNNVYLQAKITIQFKTCFSEKLRKTKLRLVKLTTQKATKIITY